MNSFYETIYDYVRSYDYGECSQHLLKRMVNVKTLIVIIKPMDCYYKLDLYPTLELQIHCVSKSLVVFHRTMYHICTIILWNQLPHFMGSHVCSTLLSFRLFLIPANCNYFNITTIEWRNPHKPNSRQKNGYGLAFTSFQCLPLPPLENISSLHLHSLYLRVPLVGYIKVAMCTSFASLLAPKESHTIYSTPPLPCAYLYGSHQFLKPSM